MGLKALSFARARTLFSVGFHIFIWPGGADRDFGPLELNRSLFDTF
jgi:hypothetical protein